MVGDGLYRVLLRFPSHIHEERDGVLHRLQVADIENPHALNAEVVGQRQLLEHLLRLRDVEPLGIAGSAHVVYMVVDAPTALAAALGSCRHAAYVAPVVVADEYHHVVRHAESGVVVVLHLLIECPHLRGLLGRLARHVLYNLALVVDDALHQLGVGLVAHGLVAVATHADGHNVLGAVHALDTLAEELVELRLIGLVVPSAPLTAMTGILLMVAGHRLVVRGAHHNAHPVGGLAILRVVGIEGPTPHGGPHHVALQAENQLEHLLIEAVVAVVGAPRVLHPRRQARSLVVEEDATELDGRLAVRVRTFYNVGLGMLGNGHVSPPIPRRHAQLAAQLVDAVDGASAVAAGNHQLAIDGGDDKLLALTLQVGKLQAVNVLVLAQRTDEDGSLP